MPFGGPNGGDGGRGGSVWAVADPQPQHAGRLPLRAPPRGAARRARQGLRPVRRGRRRHRAAHAGRHHHHRRRNRRGARRTARCTGEPVLLAKGGDGGFGNMHFKSSTNRAPRQKTPGWPGEAKKLQARAEGAGRRRPARHAQRRQVDASSARSRTRGPKSPTIRSPRCIRTWAWCASAAEQSFVIADMPGPDRGRRRRRRPRPPVPAPPAAHPPAAAPGRHGAVRRRRSTRWRRRKAIVGELKKYDAALYDKPRWLVLNKLDMVPAEERAAARQAISCKRLRWKGPVFEISALTREGCEPLVRAVYEHVRGDPPAVGRPARSALRRCACGRRGRRRARRRPRRMTVAGAPARGASSSRSARASSPTRAAASTTRPSATGAGRWRRWRRRAARW